MKIFVRLKMGFFIAVEEDLFSKWARFHSLGTAIWSPWLHGSLNQLKFNFKSIKFFQARHTRSSSMPAPVSILKWALICLECQLDHLYFFKIHFQCNNCGKNIAIRDCRNCFPVYNLLMFIILAGGSPSFI